MSARLVLLDYRYFTIVVKIERPNVEHPEPAPSYILDISTRLIFIIHAVSLRAGSPRCFHFDALCTSYPSVAFNTDILETGETRIYPAAGYPAARDFVATCGGPPSWGIVDAVKSTSFELYRLVRTRTF